MNIEYITKDEAETIKVADNFATSLKKGSVVALIGELGSGKTVFAKGVARALGVKEKVTSPTFTIIHEYDGYIPMYHMDLFRINTETEMRDIGIEDYFFGDGICLVEWAEKLGELFPNNAFRVRLEHFGPTCRKIEIERPDSG
ncbi:tRNA (adenosine(37)-N6)-threonylcarbamoyltransferase complex ATPase subunit type 1 TsaE [Candidatus Latescibacterota bacterium]